MSRFTVRTLCNEDPSALRQREADMFGAAGDSVPCPHSLRLCTELPDDIYYAVVLIDGLPVGYPLCSARGREACRTTGAIHTEFQRTRVTRLRFAAVVRTGSKIDRTRFEKLRAGHPRLGLVPRGAASA